jgi:hypothetical protein
MYFSHIPNREWNCRVWVSSTKQFRNLPGEPEEHNDILGSPLKVPAEIRTWHVPHKSHKLCCLIPFSAFKNAEYVKLEIRKTRADLHLQ